MRKLHPALLVGAGALAYPLGLLIGLVIARRSIVPDK